MFMEEPQSEWWGMPFVLRQLLPKLSGSGLDLDKFFNHLSLEAEMTTYKTFITIEDPNQTVLSNLPFQKGQRVRVVLLAEDDERATISQRLRNLFKNTQALPGVNEITEKEIVAEVTAYRRGE